MSSKLDLTASDKATQWFVRWTLIQHRFGKARKENVQNKANNKSQNNTDFEFSKTSVNHYVTQL